MRESERQFRYIFIETDNFSSKGGHLSESARQRLYFDLMLGHGEIIANTGGLKRMTCGRAGSHTRSGRRIVFAEYSYPDVNTRFFLLLARFPENVVQNLSEAERRQLKTLKQNADYYIEQRYEELLDESF
jgi:ferric iron reductase protein FhuF